MPDVDAGAEILNLGSDFPPVPTAAWEAAIAKDLKGADYEKKLVWRTEEGLAVRPYYRRRRSPNWARNSAPRRATTRSCAAPAEAGRSRRTPSRVPKPFAPICCTKPAPTPSRNWATASPPAWSGWPS